MEDCTLHSGVSTPGTWDTAIYVVTSTRKRANVLSRLVPSIVCGIIYLFFHVGGVSNTNNNNRRLVGVGTVVSALTFGTPAMYSMTQLTVQLLFVCESCRIISNVSGFAGGERCY